MRSTCRTTHFGSSRTFTKPGLATSTDATISDGGKRSRMASAISNGGRRSGLASRSATLVARSPLAGSFGVSTSTGMALASGGQPRSADARSSAARSAEAIVSRVVTLMRASLAQR